MGRRNKYTGAAVNLSANAESGYDVVTSNGARLSRPFADPASDWSYAAAAGGITDTADVAIKAAAGAGIRNYLTAIQVRNSAATASEIVVKSGSTVIWRSQVPASMTGVMHVEFPTPLKSAANAALNVALLTTATATYVNAQGYTAA